MVTERAAEGCGERAPGRRIAVTFATSPQADDLAAIPVTAAGRPCGPAILAGTATAEHASAA
jgi:hypothetical protein